jgi:hypothetical protein
VVTSRWLDFPVYWDAGKKALLGKTVYDVVGHFQYKYSPWIALLFGKLFKSLEFESASLLFQKEMLLCWIALWIRFSKWDFRVVLISILFFGNAIRLDLELGQINAFVLVSIVILFDLLERKKNLFLDLSFGLIFSLAVQMKLFALLFVPVLVFRSEWRKLGFGVLLLPLMSIGGVALAHGWSFAVSENVFLVEVAWWFDRGTSAGRSERRIAWIFSEIVWIRVR